MTQNNTTKPVLNKTQRRRVEALKVARDTLANSTGPFVGTSNSREPGEIMIVAEYILGGVPAKPEPDADPHIHVSTDQGSYAGPASLMAVHAPTLKAVA